MDDFQIQITKELIGGENAVKKIEPVLFDLKDELKIKDELFYNMLIAVTEAVNNAILHGNKGISDKMVVVSIHVSGRDIEISVTDQGNGFAPDSLEDPREPENLLKASGRGVFLIKELAKSSEFIVNSEGCTVRMNFHV